MAKKKAVKRTRRANNEGSIFQRSDGRWGGALTMGYDENGKIIRKTKAILMSWLRIITWKL